MIVALVAFRLALAVTAWEPGWSALSWDDFTRVSISRSWAAGPTLTPNLVWLPLQFWVDGVAFILFGRSFAGNPMLLVAIINTCAVIGTAFVVAWSAHRLFRSRAGALVAFVAILFSPWGHFAALSGLGEPLYYLGVAATIGATIAWLQSQRVGWLATAAACVATAELARYEGWALGGAWLVVLGFVVVEPLTSGVVARARDRIGELAILATAAIVPLGWVLLNWHRAGNPLYFARESARWFAGSYPSANVVARAAFYPFGLVRAAPLLIAAITVVVLARRRDRTIRLVSMLVGLQLAVLYANSVLISPVGAFTERFMFAFVVGLAPLVGALPGMLGSVTRHRRKVTAAVVALALVVTGARWIDRPTEWTHPPDLLALAQALGEVATPADPLTVVLGPGMANDVIPLAVRNGDSLSIVSRPDLPLTGPALSGRVIWVERLPERISSIARTPNTIVGRYALYGDVTVSTTPCTGCAGWVRSDESGDRRALPPSAYVGLEFTGDDPVPGEEASVSVMVDRATRDRMAVLDLGAMYGGGFNTGRVELQVRRDGAIVLRRDIADSTRWIDVTVRIPAGTGASEITVAVVALPGIETGWAWGRASTVIIRSLRVGSG